MLLDEPTTGLDSFTAHAIVELLSDLAKSHNKLVVMTVHQPRSDIFTLLDCIGIMSMGEIVYFGPRVDMMGYFSELGFPCPRHTNPLDKYGKFEYEFKRHAWVRPFKPSIYSFRVVGGHG